MTNDSAQSNLRRALSGGLPSAEAKFSCNLNLRKLAAARTAKKWIVSLTP